MPRACPLPPSVKPLAKDGAFGRAPALPLGATAARAKGRRFNSSPNHIPAALSVPCERRRAGSASGGGGKGGGPTERAPAINARRTRLQSSAGREEGKRHSIWTKIVFLILG